MKKKEESCSKVMYSYQGIVKSNSSSIFRYAVAMLGLPFVKSILRLLPGIDPSVKTSTDQDLAVEIVPSFWGMFTNHWEIREKRVDALNKIGVNVRAIHAPYIDDGQAFQPNRKAYLDNVLDITRYGTETFFCLYAHIHLFEMIAPKEREKVLVVHPLPASPFKKESEIIHEISKTVKKVLPALRDQNVTLVIENMPWLKKKHERYSHFLGDAIFFEKLMNEVNDPHYGVIFDWGHANSYARFMYDYGITHPEHEFTPETLAHFGYQNYFIRRLNDKIRYAHLHFNEAHDVDINPPMFFPNFDTHSDLTQINDKEFPHFKKNVKALNELPNLVGMTIESIPSFFNRKARIQRYRDSVEILNSMLQSQS